MNKLHSPLDPDLLQVIGAAADLLGLGEHMQRVLPTDRIRARRRHRRIDKLRGEFLDRLDDARSSLRLVLSVVQRRVGDGPAEFAVAVQASELPVFRRGLDGLQVAIREMTKTTYELETVTSQLPDEAQRYYRMSNAGREVLDRLRVALEGQPEGTEGLLQSVDRYLIRCSEIFSEGERWREL